MGIKQQIKDMQLALEKKIEALHEETKMENRKIMLEKVEDLKRAMDDRIRRTVKKEIQKMVESKKSNS